jgi:hypothetical protein
MLRFSHEPLEAMSSGSFNIDTFSWYRSLPLSNDTVPFSTLTMFAVGPSSFLAPYSFYQYSISSGFADTSTLSVSIMSFISTAIPSTTTGIENTLGKIYQSTFDTADFTSTYNTSTEAYPLKILTPYVSLGSSFQGLIDSKLYNVFVDTQYSLYLSSSYTSSTWVSTTGLFNSTVPFSNLGLYGRTVTTRQGNNTYQQIYNKLSYIPQPNGQETQISPSASNFGLNIFLQSTVNTISSLAPAFDLYIPGQNNYTITLVPISQGYTFNP